MGMLSRTGQSMLTRPVTPSTPTVPKEQPVKSPTSTSGASIDLDELSSLFNDCGTRSLPNVPFARANSEGAATKSTSEGSIRSAASSGEALSESRCGRLCGIEEVATPDAKSPTVRRRRASDTTHQAFNRRSLTVECNKRKLIDDYIDQSSQPNDGHSEASCKPRQHPAQAIQTPGKVLSIWGSETKPSDKFVPFFAEKRMNFEGEFDTLRHRVGIMSHRGYKPESPNQDDFFVLARRDSLLLGILDGHGPDGHDVSHWVQEKLPTYLTEHLRQDPDAWESAVGSSVKELCEHARKELGGKADFSGTTATIAMLDQPGGSTSSGSMRLRCAFLGDSIACLARRKSRNSSWEVTPLFDIHRPDRPDELERIAQAGGSVSLGIGKSPSRLQTPSWNLAMSRSFGDFHALPYGLSNEPEFAPERLLEPGYEYMILACSDGIWDMMPPQQAVNFVGKFSPDEAQLAVERLVNKAQRRWQEIEDVVDDITAVLVWPDFAEESDLEE